MAVPSDYAGLELWLKYNTGYWQDSARTTVASVAADPVGAWDDQSGNARHATQSTNARRPTLASSLTVKCEQPNNQWLALPNFLTGFTVAEIFCVLRAEFDPATGSPRFGNLWTFGSGGGLDDHYPFTDGVIYNGFGSNARKTVGNPLPSLSNYHVLQILSKSGEWSLWINGTLFFKTATNTVGWSTAPALGKTLNGLFGDHRFAELFLYSQERSGAERSALLSYAQGVIAALSESGAHRITQEGLELAGDLVPAHRITQEGLEFFGSLDPKHRITQEGADVAWDPHPPHRITQFGAEILMDNVRGRKPLSYIID